MTNIEHYLKDLVFVAHDHAVWESGKIEFEFAAAYTDILPPDSHISSVRTVLTKGEDVMVVHDPDRVHILPGGRRESGESCEQTLIREVGEETGYTIKNPRMLGIIHFKHKLSIPNGWNTDHYPHMINLIFLSEADDYQEDLREEDGYEITSGFESIQEVRQLDLGPIDLAFLKCADILSND